MMSILHEAHGLVHGDRGKDYGHPFDDLGRTAAMWTALLGVPVTAEKVAMCMVALKLSRLCNEYKRDSVVDVAGYAEVLDMVHQERGKRGEWVMTVPMPD